GLDPELITRLLDIGAQGIQYSGVGSAAEAEELVSAVRFPPVGTRGVIGNTRALGYGLVSGADGLEAAAREVLVKVTIETRAALDEVEAIAAVDGIDLIGIGPNDLAAVLGVSGRPGAPALVEAMNRVAEAARSTDHRKLSCAIGHPAYPLGPKEVAELGVAF